VFSPLPRVRGEGARERGVSEHPTGSGAVGWTWKPPHCAVWGISAAGTDQSDLTETFHTLNAGASVGESTEDSVPSRAQGVVCAQGPNDYVRPFIQYWRVPVSNTSGLAFTS
jgi:hypothetical protein